MTTPTDDTAPVEENNPSEEQLENDPNGEGTTPEEVAEVLHLPTSKADDKQDESDDEEEEDEDTDESDDSTDDSETGDDATDENEESEDTEETDDDTEDESATTSTDDADTKQFVLEVEDANGVQFTLRPGDDIEKVLEDFEPKSNGQIMKVLNDFNRLEAQKTDYDKQQEAETAKAETAKRVAEIQNGWQKEIDALTGSKRLSVDTKGNADQKRIDEVMDFMGEQNKQRAEKGLALLTSFEDALDKLELKELRAQQADKDKKDKEDTRKRGGMVGGSSAPASGSTPVYKPGARNAEEAVRAMGLV